MNQPVNNPIKVLRQGKEIPNCDLVDMCLLDILGCSIQIYGEEVSTEFDRKGKVKFRWKGYRSNGDENYRSPLIPYLDRLVKMAEGIIQERYT